MTVDQTINRLRRQSFTPEQKQRMAEANAKWRLANPEQVRAMHRSYYQRNRELIAAKTRERRQGSKA